MSSSISKAPAKQAIAAIRSAINDAMATAELAVHKAVRVGHLLIEAKADPAIGAHGHWQNWIETNFPELPYRTAVRWMEAASNVAKQIDLSGCPVPASRLLSAPAEDLPDEARGAQQLLFDFLKDKTIKDCLAAVVVEGEDAHRITRAANGKKLGGSKGENRKDWPKFIGRLLSDVSHHLKSWKSFTPAQTETVLTKFDALLAKAPDSLLSHLKTRITEELKSR